MEMILVCLNEAIRLDALYRGSKLYQERQPGRVDRVWHGDILKYYNIKRIRSYPYFGARMWYIISNVESETVKGKTYMQRIQFYDVEFSKEFTRYTPIKIIDSKTGDFVWMSFIPYDCEVGVYCDCADFRFRWEVPLSGRRALLGRVRPYERKDSERKSINVRRIASVCKHIFAIFELFAGLGIISDQWYRDKELNVTRIFV